MLSGLIRRQKQKGVRGEVISLFRVNPPSRLPPHASRVIVRTSGFRGTIADVPGTGDPC